MLNLISQSWNLGHAWVKHTPLSLSLSLCQQSPEQAWSVASWPNHCTAAQEATMKLSRRGSHGNNLSTNQAETGSRKSKKRGRRGRGKEKGERLPTCWANGCATFFTRSASESLCVCVVCMCVLCVCVCSVYASVLCVCVSVCRRVCAAVWLQRFTT